MMDYDLLRDGFQVWMRWTDTGDNPRYVVSVENNRQQIGQDVTWPFSTVGLKAAHDFGVTLSIALDIPFEEGYMGSFRKD